MFHSDPTLMPRITTSTDRRIQTAEPVDWDQVEPEIIYRIIVAALAGSCIPVRVASNYLGPHFQLRRASYQTDEILRYCIAMHQRLMLELPAGQRAQEIWQEYRDIYESYWDRFGVESRHVDLSSPPANLYGAEGSVVREQRAPQGGSSSRVRRMDVEVMAGDVSVNSSEQDEDAEWLAYLKRRKAGGRITVVVSGADEEVRGSEYQMFRIRWWTTHLEWPEPRVPPDIQTIVSYERRRERRRRAALSDAIMSRGMDPGPQLIQAQGGREPPHLPAWFMTQGLLEMFLVELRFMHGVYPPWPGLPHMPFFRPNWRRYGWPACWDFRRPPGRSTPEEVERALFYG